MVRYSNEVRDSFMTGDVDHMMGYYKSLKVFDKLAHDPANKIVYKLKEGRSFYQYDFFSFFFFNRFFKSTFLKLEKDVHLN